MELNEFECGMLDVVLEALGIGNSLSQEQLLELFDEDEAAAFGMVQVLVREGLVTEERDRLLLNAKGEQLLKDGGFTHLYNAKKQNPEPAKPIEAGGTLAKLQQQNMRLQQQRLEKEQELSRLQEAISRQRMIQVILLVLIIVALVVGFLIGRHSHIFA